MSGIKNYSTSAASNTTAPPNGAPEGMAPSSVNNTIRQIMADIRSFYEAADYIDLGHTPTYATRSTTHCCQSHIGLGWNTRRK